jgi:TonB family protein
MLEAPASAVTAQLVLSSPDFGDRPDLLKSCGVSPVSAPPDSKLTNDAKSKEAAVKIPHSDATGGNSRPGSTLASSETAPLLFYGASGRTTAVCFESIEPKGIWLYGKETEAGDYYLRYRAAIQPAEQYSLRMDSDNFTISTEPRGYVLGAYRIASGRHLFTITVRNPVDKLLIEFWVQGTSATAPRGGLRRCSSGNSEQLQSDAARKIDSTLIQSPAVGDVGDDMVGGAFHIGGGVSAPVVIFKPEPGYSEEASAAKLNGNVTLGVVIGVDGKAKQITVVRPLGMGLDEKAIEAVEKWRFKPGTKDGNPVPVRANIEVNFRLL